MRERTHTVQRPSLFPFLSVLVCLIGVLTFLAASLALTALGKAQGNVEIEIEAGDSTHGKTPVMIECVSNKAFTVGGEHTFDEEQEDEVWKAANKDHTVYDHNHTDFTRFLRDLAAESDKYVLFIVRPDGLSMYATLRNNTTTRNKALRLKTVTVYESLDDIPKALLKRGVRYSGNELRYEGKMSAEDRDALRALFSRQASLDAVDALYEKTQAVPAAVDYGTELLPAEWKLHGAGHADEAEEERSQLSGEEA
jgi:hypothetical protein